MGFPNMADVYPVTVLGRKMCGWQWKAQDRCVSKAFGSFHECVRDARGQGFNVRLQVPLEHWGR